MKGIGIATGLAFAALVGGAGGQEPESGEAPVPPNLGVYETSPDYSVPGGAGVVVTRGARDSDPDHPGLRAGDLVVRIGDVSIHDQESHDAALAARKAGERVTVGIVRAGEAMEVEIELQALLPDLGSPIEFPDPLALESIERVGLEVERACAAGGWGERLDEMSMRFRAWRSYHLTGLSEAGGLENANPEAKERAAAVLDPLERRVIWAARLSESGVRPPVHDCGPPAAYPAEIEHWVALLGSEDFGERERALARLVDMGEASVAALVAASAGLDPEVSLRAQQALERIRGQLSSRPWPPGGTAVDLVVLSVAPGAAGGSEGFRTALECGVVPECRDEVEFSLLRDRADLGRVRAVRGDDGRWKTQGGAAMELSPRTGDVLASWVRTGDSR